jgi:hypothetical protein
MSKLGERLREWDEWVENGDHDETLAEKPYHAGVMLAIAELFDSWDNAPPHPENVTPAFVQAMRGLRHTVEEIVDRETY